MLNQDGLCKGGKKAPKGSEQSVPVWKRWTVTLLPLFYVAFYVDLVQTYPKLSGWGVLGILVGSILFCLLILAIAKYEPKKRERQIEQ